MSLKDTKELEDVRAKLEEARAELERMSATISDQESTIMSMKTVLQRLNEENESLDIENAKLDAENATLVKSLEMKCLELLKSKSAPKVVVTAPLTTRPVVSASSGATATASAPVRRPVKMSFLEANPDIRRQIFWDSLFDTIDRWFLPVSVVALLMIAFWRFL